MRKKGFFPISVVRCIFDKEECLIQITGTDFDTELLDEVLSGTLKVRLGVGETTYSNISSWTQYNSGSGTWTKYRKD
ncbi:MAG: hypothetical protein D3923_18685 [Candidatus Electrothrix sp. AR3]|nr:hypothetical protein [Candidatus Electrothrix sp. AR3]